ncbi:hypothetical protein T484DRAFT_1938037 [Baffinella frigidus]|nr:hypothetical protein T484DRAFT_1938037 [Cryptophyta sp. CCMP2293]
MRALGGRAGAGKVESRPRWYCLIRVRITSRKGTTLGPGCSKWSGVPRTHGRPRWSPSNRHPPTRSGPTALETSA